MGITILTETDIDEAYNSRCSMLATHKILNRCTTKSAEKNIVWAVFGHTIRKIKVDWKGNSKQTLNV